MKREAEGNIYMHNITVTMLGASGVGKTTLLTSMYNEFQQTIGTTNLQLRPDKVGIPILNQTLMILEELANEYEIGASDNPIGTELKRDFGFDIGKRGDTPSLHIDFVDYPGGWLTSGNEKLDTLLRDSAAVLIAIDTPAMMSTEKQGHWNLRFNRPNDILGRFQHAYEKLSQPRLVIFAPIKCEKYVQDAESIKKLQQAIKKTYEQLFELFRSLSPHVAIVIAPVQTMGCMYFSRIDLQEEMDRTTNRTIKRPVFKFRKKNPDDIYQSKNCEQPLRYLLRFLLKLHFDKRAQDFGIFRFIHDWFLDQHLKEAVTTFAQGCKVSDGFEVVQGAEWLRIE